MACSARRSCGTSSPDVEQHAAAIERFAGLSSIELVEELFEGVGIAGQLRDPPPRTVVGSTGRGTRREDGLRWQ
jgi:hypothetical protein